MLEVVGGATGISDSGNIVLRSEVDEKEEATKVGSSVWGEDIPEEFRGDGVGVEGVAVGDGGNPDGVVAAGNPERMGNLRTFIVE